MESAPGGDETTAPERTPEADGQGNGKGAAKAPITRFFHFLTGRRPASEEAQPAPTAETAPRPPPPASDTQTLASFQHREAAEWAPPELAPHLEEDLRSLEYDDSYECEQAGCEGWNVLGATRRGRLHAHKGTHREDALAVATGPHFTVLCVSDGAGSCKYSRIGSEIAVRTVRRELEGFLTRQASALEILARPALVQVVGTAMGEAVKSAMEAIIALAGRAGCHPRDFRCTLLLTVLYTGPNGGLVLASQVGDGCIATLDRDGLVQRQVTADADGAGDFSGEVKCFVPDGEALQFAYRFKPLDPEKLEAVILCTDGVEDAFFPIAKHGPSIFFQLYQGVADVLPGFRQQCFHGPILGQPRSRRRLRDWLKFEKRGENDDRTILILHRLPAQAPEELCAFVPPPPSTRARSAST